MDMKVNFSYSSLSWFSVSWFIYYYQFSCIFYSFILEISLFPLINWNMHQWNVICIFPKKITLEDSLSFFFSVFLSTSLLLFRRFVLLLLPLCLSNTLIIIFPFKLCDLNILCLLGGFNFLNNNFLGEMERDRFEKTRFNKIGGVSSDFLNYEKYDISENAFGSPYLPKKRFMLMKANFLRFFQSKENFIWSKYLCAGVQVFQELWTDSIYLVIYFPSTTPPPPQNK